MSRSVISNKVLTDIQADILKTALYYDVFNYPLTKQELYQNHSYKVGSEEFQSGIENLVTQGFLFQTKEFYLLANSPESNILKRLNGNDLANRMFPIARRNSLFIAKFPFVSGVNISGSLSKNYYDEQSDIDYFIITKANRLWLCRTIFILYYKTLSKKRKKHFCLNYFISEADLVINDKNPFVAKELAYLIPTVNKKTYQNLLENNSWYRAFYLNKDEQSLVDCDTAQEPWYKRAFEFVFAGRFGNWIDSALLRMTLKHWQKKHETVSKEDFELQFRSRKHVCKYHTHGNQNKILQFWKEKIQKFESENGIKLN